MWKKIDGYRYNYRVNDQGEVQKLAGQKWVLLKPKVVGNRACVSLRDKTGKQTRVPLVRLMDEYFFGGRAKREGLCVYHKNGIKTDCAIENLLLITQSEIGQMQGSRGSRKTVIRYDRHGNATVYKSLKEAAQKNGISTTSLDRRIYGNVLDPRGYKFVFEVKKC